MMGPGSLWTAANHHVPLLTIMHNNQGFHNEFMEAQRLALRRGRDGARAQIGNRLIEPVIDYAKMAESMGMHGEGPISDPKDLGPSLKHAVEVVKPVMEKIVDEAQTIFGCDGSNRGRRTRLSMLHLRASTTALRVG